jgi:1-acyl-sn-glycerol-3-phosphate acyltransferase
MRGIRFLRFLFISLPLIGLISILWPVASLFYWAFGGSPDGQLQLGRIWAKKFLALSFIRVQYVGLENFEGLGPCVLVANHPSLLDVPVLYGIPARGSILAAKQLFYNPFLSIQLRTGQHLPLGGRGARDTIKSIRIAIRLIAETGRAVLIFPEEAHLDAKLHPFEQGAAFIAIVAGVPIVPIALSGTRQFMGGTVTVRIGEPIGTEGLTVSDRGSLTACAHGRVAELMQMERQQTTEGHALR